MIDGEEIWQRKKRRAFFIGQLYQWHWISSGICLIGMIIFALTGITLNHASQIESRPTIVTRDGQLPAEIIAILKNSVRRRRKTPYRRRSAAGFDARWA